MAKQSKFFKFYTVETQLDGEKMFNIEKMLNENWERIESMAAIEQLLLLNGATYTTKLVVLSGDLDEWTTEIHYQGEKIITIVEREMENGWHTTITKHGDIQQTITIIETYDHDGTLRGVVSHA